MIGKRSIITILTALFLLTVALAPFAGQQAGTYDPWLDYNDDGVINVLDLQALAEVYGTSGTPLSMPTSVEYDSGWIDITDKRGQYFNITHNLNITTAFIPRACGKATLGGEVHQRFLDATGLPPGWNQTFGTGEAYSVVQTNDGGYAIAGIMGGDFWLVKTDENGTMDWSRTYGGAGQDEAQSVVQTNDGGYAIAGYAYSFGAGLYDFWLVKTDSAGNEEWNRTYGGADYEMAYSLVQTGDGGYAIAGYTQSFAVSGVYDFWLVKTDSAGNVQWNKTYGYDVAYSMIQTVDGGYAIAGYTYSYDGGSFQNDNFALVKTDENGTMDWSQRYFKGWNTDECAYSLIQTSDGGFALAGDFDFGGPSNFWLVKTDSAGIVQWDRSYGGLGGSNWARSVTQTIDGGYAIAGSTNEYGAGSWDFWLVKTDENGTMDWSRTYGGAGQDEAQSVVQTNDGGYAIAGIMGGDFWLVKTDAGGLMEWSELGIAITDYTADTLTLYRGAIDPYWNYVRVRILAAKQNP